MERASRALPAEDPLAQVFCEEREDLRVDLRPEAPATVIPTRLRGLRARRGGGHPRSVFRAWPSPADVVEIAGCREAENREPLRSDCNGMSQFEGENDAAPVVAWLEDLRRRGEAAAGGRARLSARWVGFRQLVAVARSGGRVRTDLRRGARVRLELSLPAKRDRRARAVVERVFRPPLWIEDPSALLEALIERAEARRRAGPPSAGETVLLVAPGAGGILVHELVGHALEADTVLRGASALAFDASIAPSDVTIVDDPRRGRGAWKRDDEGVECRPTPLVEAGRVSGRLYDLATAARDGREPTGHGRRSSFREPVRPRMGCTFLAPGRLEPEEILEETASGIYVRRMETASTDSRSGRAIFVVTDADRIDQGQPGRPLDPFLLELRASTALPSLDRIGNDLAFDTCVGSCLRDGQPLATSVGAPTIRIGVARVVS